MKMNNKLILIILLSFLFTSCKKDPVAPSAKITYIKATSWPSSDSNQIPWDTASAPDIYFELLDANLQELSNQPFDDSVFVNATSTVDRPIVTPYKLPSTDANYYIQLLDDDDTDADDSIGKVQFNLSDYPVNSAVIFRSSNGIALEIGLAWE